MFKRRTFIIKLVITILLLLYLIFKIDLDKIVDTFKNTNLMLISVAVFLIFIIYSLRVIKWGVLLSALDIKVSFIRRFKIILIGIFYSFFTPAKAGELARAYFLKRDFTKTIPTILWDKILDAVALVTLSLVFMIIFKVIFTKSGQLVLASIVRAWDIRF